MTEATKDALLKVYRVLAEIGKPPTNNYVFAIVRGSRHRFTDKEGKDVLAQARSQGRAPGPPLDSRSHAPGPPDAAPASRARGSQRNLDIVPYVQGSIPLPSGNGHAAPPPEPGWVTELRGWYRPLKERPLKDLTLAERLIVARYYAFCLCRCTKSEPTNKRTASGIDAGIGYVQSRIAKDPKVADMTASEYIDLGRKRAKRLGVALYKPIEVLAELEFEGTPV